MKRILAALLLLLPAILPAATSIPPPALTLFSRSVIATSSTPAQFRAAIEIPGSMPPSNFVGGVAYVATNGSDLNSGAVDSPFYTLAKANQYLGGIGTIVVGPGDFTNQVFDLSVVTNIVVSGNSSSTNRTRFINGEKVTSWTHLSNNVYTATLTGTVPRWYANPTPASETLFRSPWLFEWNTPEGFINSRDRHALQRQGNYRLPHYRLKRANGFAPSVFLSLPTSWTNLAEAITYVAANNGTWCFDTNTSVIYVKFADGGTNTGKVVYVPTSHYNANPQSFCYGGNDATTIRFQDIDVFFAYNGFDASSCASFSAVNCTVYGNQNEGVYAKPQAGRTELVRVESAANNNDGLGYDNTIAARNFRFGGSGIELDCWIHDNADCGTSAHYGAENTIIGGLYEWNGKGALLPYCMAKISALGTMIRANFIGVKTDNQQATQIDYGATASNNITGAFLTSCSLMSNYWGVEVGNGSDACFISLDRCYIDSVTANVLHYTNIPVLWQSIVQMNDCTIGPKNPLQPIWGAGTWQYPKIMASTNLNNTFVYQNTNMITTRSGTNTPGWEIYGAGHASNLVQGIAMTAYNDANEIRFQMKTNGNIGVAKNAINTYTVDVSGTVRSSAGLITKSTGPLILGEIYHLYWPGSGLIRIGDSGTNGNGILMAPYGISATTNHAILLISYGSNSPVKYQFMDGTGGVNARVGISTNNPQATLHVNGDTWINGALCLNLTNAASPTAASGRAWIYTRGTNAGASEVYVMDGAGNATLISPHSVAAPASLYDKEPGLENVYHSFNVNTGSNVFVNFTRMAALVEAMAAKQLPELPLAKRTVMIRETFEDTKARVPGIALEKQYPKPVEETPKETPVEDPPVMEDPEKIIEQ